MKDDSEVNIPIQVAFIQMNFEILKGFLMSYTKRRREYIKCDAVFQRVDSFESDIYETEYVMVGNDQKEEDYLTTRHEDNFKSSFES